MAWNLEGKNVAGKYHGVSFEGVVLESRVRYGGQVSHTIELDHAIQMRWRSDPTTTIIANTCDIVVM